MVQFFALFLGLLPASLPAIIYGQNTKDCDETQSGWAETPCNMHNTEPNTIDHPVYTCMDLMCACSYLGGTLVGSECRQINGQPLQKALRKEYRQLTDAEREKFHFTLRRMKDSGLYDRISILHQTAFNAGAAHGGPSLLPWHREFLKRFEFELRHLDPSIVFPYWDSSLDGHLPNPPDSILFTEKFIGMADHNGNVYNGPFANWRTFDGYPNLRRWVGSRNYFGNIFGILPNQTRLQALINDDRTEIMMGFPRAKPECAFFPLRFKTVENLHNGIHSYIGGISTPFCVSLLCMGDMTDFATSSNDPLFWLHHNMMDMMFELWRQRKPRASRETIYPLDNEQCAGEINFAQSPMYLLPPWKNIDGLSNKYTDNLYEYAPSPSCAMGPDCGSKYLFCDQSHGALRCASKVRLGGNCVGFTKGESVCIEGFCQNGRCV